MFMFREDDVTTPTEKRLRISGQPDNVNYGRQLVMYLLASRDHTDDNEGKHKQQKRHKPEFTNTLVLSHNIF